jgi:hypothetical protein
MRYARGEVTVEQKEAGIWARAYSAWESVWFKANDRKNRFILAILMLPFDVKECYDVMHINADLWTTQSKKSCKCMCIHMKE